MAFEKLYWIITYEMTSAYGVKSLKNKLLSKHPLEYFREKLLMAKEFGFIKPVIINYNVISEEHYEQLKEFYMCG